MQTRVSQVSFLNILIQNLNPYFVKTMQCVSVRQLCKPLSTPSPRIPHWRITCDLHRSEQRCSHATVGDSVPTRRRSRIKILKGFSHCFFGLTSKFPPLGSMLNFDADVKNTTMRHQCENRLTERDPGSLPPLTKPGTKQVCFSIVELILPKAGS